MWEFPETYILVKLWQKACLIGSQHIDSQYAARLQRAETTYDMRMVSFNPAPSVDEPLT